MTENIEENVSEVKECYVCGKHSKTVLPYWIYLWDYGVRNRQLRQVCASCRALDRKGEL